MKLYLISGLPRSGRHFLTTVIDQNPKFYTAVETPLCELVYRQFSLWVDKDREYQEDLLNDKIRNMQHPFLKNYIANFYSNLTNKKIVFDSSFSWHNRYNIWMLKLICEEAPKVICCVRDMEEIAASYTNLYNNNGRFFEEYLVYDGTDLIKTYNELWKTRSSSFRGSLHIVKYNDLVDDHDNTMKKIYKFIEQPYFKTDFKKIKRNKDYDKAEELHRLKGLHNIKEGLEKSDTDINKTLSKIQIKYWKRMNWWNR